MKRQKEENVETIGNSLQKGRNFYFSTTEARFVVFFSIFTLYLLTLRI